MVPCRPVDAPREVADGRYRLGERLGSGSTGTVYAGTGPDGERVAIKLLHDELTAYPDVVARFKREASLAARIDSAYVASVLAAGKTQAGTYWIAYRRLLGEPLDRRLRSETVFRVDQARVVIEHVLLGLQVAHLAGIVHRDIKPANLFLEDCEGGARACILDFGLSKYRPPSGAVTSQHLTTARETLGTINYMPPEQFGGAARVDARADLYATGVVAFKLLTGTLPFMAGTRGAIMQAKVNGRSLSLTEATEAALPDRLEALFRVALAQQPDDRYPSASAMLASWQAAACGDDLPDVDGLRRRQVGSTQGQEDTVVDAELCEAQRA